MLIILSLILYAFLVMYTPVDPFTYIGLVLIGTGFTALFSRKHLPATIFYLITGMLMGTHTGDKATGEIAAYLFEFGLLFLGYFAMSEFLENRLKLNLKNILLFEPFFILLLFFAIFSITYTPAYSLLSAIFFVSISPITSLLILYQGEKVEEKVKRALESHLILREGFHIIAIMIAVNLIFPSSHQFLNLLESWILGSAIGFLLKFLKPGRYELVIAMVITLFLGIEHFYHLESLLMVFGMVLTGPKTIRINRDLMKIAGILYPFIYTYAGLLFVRYLTISSFLFALLLAVFKYSVEVLSFRLWKCRFPLLIGAVKVPIAGISLYHLIRLNSFFPPELFKVLFMALILTEFISFISLAISRRIQYN